MSKGTQSSKLRFVGPGEIRSVVVDVDESSSGNWLALRFPADGYVTRCTIFAKAAGSQTSIGLKNGGGLGAGTVVTAAQVSGTFVAGSAYNVPITTNGPEQYNEGDLCMVNLTQSAGSAACAVQIDYVLHAVPVG